MFFQKVLALVATLLWCAAAQAIEVLPHTVKYAPTSAPWGDYDLADEIARAQELLGRKRAGFKAVRSGDPKAFNVLLAVKTPGRDIEAVSISEWGANFRGFEIHWNRWNGINTPFMIRKPSDYVVLAIRRWTRSGYREAVYTPFTTDIDTPAMREAGMRYLQDLFRRAREELARKGVRSYARRWHSVHDVVPTDLGVLLAIIEHIDPGRIHGEKIELLMNEVLVIVAANGRNAYRYSRSDADARGLVQFTKKTYLAMVAKYPRAKLKPDFIAGTNDHLNAAQATLLLFDADLAALEPVEIAKLLSGQNKKDLDRYLAVAYNGGAGRAKSAYRTKDWNSKVRLETRMYLRKLELVLAALGGTTCPDERIQACW